MISLEAYHFFLHLPGSETVFLHQNSPQMQGNWHGKLRYTYTVKEKRLHLMKRIRSVKRWFRTLKTSPGLLACHRAQIADIRDKFFMLSEYVTGDEKRCPYISLKQRKVLLIPNKKRHPTRSSWCCAQRKGLSITNQTPNAKLHVQRLKAVMQETQSAAWSSYAHSQPS